MDTYTPALQRGFLAIPTQWQATPTSITMRSDADRARAANNVRQWRSYLPEDCVNTMIQMGWDLST